MDREVLWIGRDNTIDVLLKTNGVAQDLSEVTHMALVFSGVTFTSVGRSTWFDWASGTTGQLSLALGGVTGVSPGVYDVRLIVYDVSNPDGVMWGFIPTLVKS
jgi:hypothetical protein